MLYLVGYFFVNHPCLCPLCFHFYILDSRSDRSMQPIDKSLALLGASKNATLTEIKNSYKYDLEFVFFSLFGIILGKRFWHILQAPLEPQNWMKYLLHMLRLLKIFNRKLFNKAVKILQVQKCFKNVKKCFLDRKVRLVLWFYPLDNSDQLNVTTYLELIWRILESRSKKVLVDNLKIASSEGIVKIVPNRPRFCTVLTI